MSMPFLPMNVVSVDLGYACNRDSFALLACKWMIGRLQLDKGPDPVVPQVDAGLQIFRTRIERQLGGEPAEERADVRSLRRPQAPAEFLEIVRTQGYPYAPAERFWFAKDRNLQAAADEEILLVDDTNI